MKLIIILIGLVVSIKNQAITAYLKLIQYEPYVFQLDFSEPVQKPSFQLIRNHLNEIPHTFLTNQSVSKTFFIGAQPSPLSSKESLQNYQIIFNNPLKIGSGRLGVNYFMIKSSKNAIIAQSVPAFGIVIVALGYLLVLFTDLTQKMIQFMRIYCLIMFINGNKSNLYTSMSKALLLINPNSTTSQQFQQEYIVFYVIPIIIVTVTGIVGFFLKRCVRDKNSVVSKFFYQNIVYDLFVTASINLTTPIFFNSLGFFNMQMDHKLALSTKTTIICSISSLFGIILSPAIIYLFAYQINPKYKQKQQSWNQYLKSQNFDNFRKIHHHVHLNYWYKRNQLVIIMTMRIVRLMFFFVDQVFVEFVFFLLFIQLLYVFTIRPFKNELYVNINVILRLSKIAFFGIVIIGNLYFSLGDITIIYDSVSKYILARDIIFLIILLEFVVFIIYQLIVKCSNFNYRVKLIRQQNQYKFKITQKNIPQRQTESRRHKNTVDSEDRQSPRARVLSSTTNSQSINNKLASSQVHHQRKISRDGKIMTSSVIVQKQQKQSTTKRKTSPQRRKKQKKQIEMEDMTQRKLIKDVEKLMSPTSSRSKWKKQSLLAQMSKEK